MAHPSLRIITGLVLLIGCSSENQLPDHGSGGMTSMGNESGGASSGGDSGLATGGSTGSSDSGGSDQVGDSGGSSSGGSVSTGGSSEGGGSGGGAASSFALTSPAFNNVSGCSVENSGVCEVFPDENVSYMDGANKSPELHWTDAPEGTQSFAIVLFDVSYGQAHWALWNIPGEANMLAADVQKDTPTPAVPIGSQQATANFSTTGGSGYFGPHLPCNVFEFQIYALSTPSFSPERPDSAVLVSIELAELSEPEVLGMARLTGRSNDDSTTCQ